MIDKLVIEDFQAHENLEIDFGKHVTTIVGATDSGKSSIIRALGLVAFNRPSGTAYIRKGAKNASVSLHGDFGEIRRTVGSGYGNIYSLNDADFTAFKTNVPDPIVQALNVSEINFQNQHDSPFWLSETGGEVSRQLNRIVNLDVIDTTLSNLDSMIRQCRQEQSVVENRIVRIKESRRATRYVKEMDADFRRVEKLFSTYESLSDGMTILQNLIQDMQKYNSMAFDLEGFVTYGSKVVWIGEKATEISQRCERLSKLICDIKYYQGVLDVKLPTNKEIQQIEDFYKQVDHTTKRRDDLSVLIEDITECQELVKQRQEKAGELENEFNGLMGETCPLCGAEVER